MDSCAAWRRSLSLLWAETPSRILPPLAACMPRRTPTGGGLACPAGPGRDAGRSCPPSTERRTRPVPRHAGLRHSLCRALTFDQVHRLSLCCLTFTSTVGMDILGRIYWPACTGLILLQLGLADWLHQLIGGLGLTSAGSTPAIPGVAPRSQRIGSRPARLTLAARAPAR